MSLVPGIETDTINSLVPTQGAPINAIALIGHLGTTKPAGISVFNATDDGDVLEFASLTDALDTLGGQCDGTGWVAGVADIGAGATTPYDSKDNLLRALDLIYAGNSGAKVYVCVLDGDGDPISATTSLPDGAQRAMDVLLDYQDVAYVVLANIDPVAAGVSHAELGDDKDSPYNSPRFYVTGLDQFKVWDLTGGNGTPVGGVKVADFANWTTEQSTIGLVLNYFGNHMYDFSRVVNSIVSDDVVVEIGGQLAAAHLAGVLSAQADNFGITNFPALGVPWYNGKKYIFKTKTELNNIITAGYICTRFNNNSYIMSKGITFTSDEAWRLYAHRQITNGIHKQLAINLFAYVGDPMTTGLFIGAQQQAEQILDSKVAIKYVKGNPSPAVSVKPDPIEVDAFKVDASFETVKTANKVKLTLTVS